MELKPGLRCTTQAVAVGDCVELLDSDLQTLYTLSFNDAFPRASSSGHEHHIDALAIDPVNERVR